MATSATGNAARVTSAKTFNNSRWHHVLVAVDKSEATGMTLYGDGSEGAYDSQESPVAVGNLDNTGEFRIGGTTDLYFTGRIARLRQFNFGAGNLPAGAGNTPADYALWRYHNPFAALSQFNNGGWSGDTVRGEWWLDGNYTDQTGNALNLTEGGSGNQFVYMDD